MQGGCCLAKAMCLFGGLTILAGVPAPAQTSPRFDSFQLATNREGRLEFATVSGRFYRLDFSSNLLDWTPWITLQGTGREELADAGAPYANARYYRGRELEGTGHVTGDHLPTSAGDVVIHPIDHASFVMQWSGLMIYNDPVGGAGPYTGLPSADLILVSHSHGDHFNASTLDAVGGPAAVIVAPQAVYNGLSTTLRAQTVVLNNGQSTNVAGLNVAAVPAYNSNHPVGSGNGYVVTIGGRRIYMSGDTGAIAEMRALADIDVAFLAMNVPYTMSVDDAAGAVRDFQPRIVYPYHFRNQGGTFADLERFRNLVGSDHGIEVRVRDWY